MNRSAALVAGFAAGWFAADIAAVYLSARDRAALTPPVIVHHVDDHEDEPVYQFTPLDDTKKNPTREEWLEQVNAVIGRNR